MSVSGWWTFRSSVLVLWTIARVMGFVAARVTGAPLLRTVRTVRRFRMMMLLLRTPLPGGSIASGLLRKGPFGMALPISALLLQILGRAHRQLQDLLVVDVRTSSLHFPDKAPSLGVRIRQTDVVHFQFQSFLDDVVVGHRSRSTDGSHVRDAEIVQLGRQPGQSDVSHAIDRLQSRLPLAIVGVGEDWDLPCLLLLRTSFSLLSPWLVIALL